MKINVLIITKRSANQATESPGTPIPENTAATSIQREKLSWNLSCLL